MRKSSVVRVNAVPSGTRRVVGAAEDTAERCPVGAKGNAGEQDRTGQELVGVEHLLHPGDVDEAEHVAAPTVALDGFKAERHDDSCGRRGRRNES